MSSRVTNAYGDMTIGDQVIERIASQTTMECYGIVGLAAKSPKENIYRLLRLENMANGVHVISAGEDHVVIQVHVIMDAGVRISMVAENVIESVRYNVESKTGLHVDSVDVIVQGLRA